MSIVQRDQRPTPPPPPTGTSAMATRAFTLLEVMIVIVIILAILGFVGANLLGQRDKAGKDMVMIQMRLIKDSLSRFNVDMGRFPTDEEGLKALWDKSALPEEDQGKWTAYMSEPTPNDRWGSAWGYRQVGEKGPEGWFDLWSYGADKQDGTADDIDVWEGKGRSTDGSSGSSGSSTSTPSGGSGSGGGGAGGGGGGN